VEFEDILDASFECALGARKTRDARFGDHTHDPMWGTALQKMVLRCKS
jgi:hypothetical protein